MHIEDFAAERTAELCQKQHMTMYRLAQITGSKQSTISNIIKRKTIPSLITVEKLCSGFGITLSQFFQEDDRYICLTPKQIQILDIWTALSSENKKVIKKVMQGMTENE